MPRIDFPGWSEPVFPHLTDDDLYEEDGEDDPSEGDY